MISTAKYRSISPRTQRQLQHPSTSEKKKKELPESAFLLCFVALAVIAFFVLLLSYHSENNEVLLNDKGSFEAGSIEDVKFNIESISTEDNGSKLVKGWFVLPGVTYDYYNYGNDAHRSNVYNYVNLCLVKDDQVYIFPTKLELRTDVNNIISDGIDYRYSGIKANIPKEYVSLLDDYSFAFLTSDPDEAQTLYIEE